MSMQQSGTAVRLACATARRHLRTLAGRFLDVDPAQLQVEDGVVYHPGGGNRVSYDSLLADGPFGIPVEVSAPVKDPGKHVRIGRPVTAKGMADIISGRTEFVHDIELPLGSTVKDALDKVRALEEFRHVIFSEGSVGIFGRLISTLSISTSISMELVPFERFRLLY